MNDIERERLVMDVFASVCEAPADQRAAILAERCADDADLRTQVERLLTADSQQGLSDAAADRFLHAAVTDVVTNKTLALTSDGFFLGSSSLNAQVSADYRILRVIGEGGMGTVYEAEQTHPRRRVAIKVVRGDLRTPRARRRFEYEAQVLASLEHPSIARLYEADVRPTDVRTGAYLVMEFVDGVALDQYAKEKSLDLRERLELFLRICEPIAYAHRMGVIHRDLKPANVLVMPDGQPKVLDFGVARTLEMTASGGALTGEGQIVGTLAYMSPEQFDGRAPVDTRTDVYALGVVLHQLLTGRDPIDVNGEGLASAAHKLLNVIPEPIGRHDRRLRGDLETIVTRSLEKEPARRYASVEQLAAEVRRHLAGEPIEARADSAAYVLRRAAWRHRRWVLAFAAVLVTVSGFAIYASMQSERNNRLAIDAARARDDASTARVTAEQRAEDLRHSLYIANIAFGRVSLDQREVVPLRRALESCDADLRDWEWFYMRRLADRAEVTIDPEGERNTAADVDPGHRVVVFGLRDGGFRAVSATDGHEICRGDLEGERTKVAISAGADLFVVMSTTEIAAYALPSGQQLWRMKKPGVITPDRIGVNTVRISNDQQLVAASDYYGISLLRAKDGFLVRRIEDTKQLMTIEFTPDSNGLVLAESMGRLRRLDLEGKTVTDYPGFAVLIQRLGFSSDGRWLAAGNYQGRTMIWNAQNGQVHLSNLETAGAAVRRFSFSPDNSVVYLAGDDRLIRAVDMRSGQLRDAYVGHADGVLIASIDRSGTRLLSVARDNVIKHWPVPLPPPGIEFARGPLQPAGIAFNRDSSMIYAAGYDGKVRGWSRQRPSAPAREFGEAVPISCMAADRDGTRIITGNFEGGVRVWDTAGGKTLSRMTCATRVTSAAFSPDGKTILTGDFNGKLQFWDTTSGTQSRAIDVHGATLYAITFHPDGHTLATAGGDGMIRIWRWPEMTLLNETVCDPRAVTDAVFSPDGRWLIACSESKSPSLRDARTLKVVHALVGDGGGIRSVSFSPNSRRLITSGHDGTARVWDVERGRELISLRCGTAFVHRSIFSPDGRSVATIDAGGSLRLWAGPPDSPPATRVAEVQSERSAASSPNSQDN